jgi:hypothetical protein
MGLTTLSTASIEPINQLSKLQKKDGQCTKEANCLHVRKSGDNDKEKLREQKLQEQKL